MVYNVFSELTISMNAYSGHNESLPQHPDQNQFFEIINDKKHKQSDSGSHKKVVNAFLQEYFFLNFTPSIFSFQPLGKEQGLRELQTSWQKAGCLI